MNNDALDTLNQLWRLLRRSDQKSLAPARRRLIELVQSGRAEKEADAVRKYLKQLENAAARSLVTPAEKLKVEFPDNLPITSSIDEIKAALRQHNVIIVCGATGSGKTTQLPKIMLELGCGRSGRIGCTQPRRLAATALAGRLAEETCVELGREVGVKIRFDDRTGDSTVIKFMTDGILLAETRSDPELLQYDCIILDEVHERSLNIDFLLGYLKRLLEKRQDLKVVISSATLEAGGIAAFFDNAPVIEIPGGLFPVEDVYMPPQDDEDLEKSIANALTFLYDLDPNGDVLVFLPGEREIRDTLEYIEGRKLPRTELLVLYGRLGAAEQDKIFRRSRFRRVILSTNVAETSLTIPGIRFVVDSGLVRLSRYNPRTRIQELRLESVSQAGAKQRRGRCGRLSDGVCVRLYSESDFENSPAYTAPEIQRSSLAGVILQMAVLRLPPISEFPFVNPPGGALIREGLRTLLDLQAVGSDHRITETGRRLAALPIDPHMGKMLLEAEKMKVLPFMAVITAFLSISDPRERPMEEINAAQEAHRRFNNESSDFLGIIKLWEQSVRSRGENNSNSAMRRFCNQNYLSFKRMQEWRNLAFELAETFSVSLDIVDFETAQKEYEALHKCILSGMPRQMAVWDAEEKCYRDMAGKSFLPFPASGLAKRKQPAPWIMFFALMETSRVFGRCCAEVKSQWLFEVAPQLCKAKYDNISFDERSGFVYARERLTAGSLLIHPGRRKHYGEIDPVISREIFIREGLVPGKIQSSTAPWVADYNTLLEMMQDLECRMRRINGIVDEEAIFDFFNSKLPESINSSIAVKRHWQKKRQSFAPEAADIAGSDASALEQAALFPDSIVSGGVKMQLTYAFDPGEDHDGITLHVRENELNLVNPHVLDYLVPGLLPEKLHVMFRSLPKAIRRELQPAAETIETLMSCFRKGEVLMEQPLTAAVCDFLHEYLELDLSPDLLQNADYPEYLTMKLAVCGDKGIKKILRTFPGKSTIGSRLSCAVPGAKRFSCSPAADWPLTGELPETSTVSPDDPREIYPALIVEDGLIGCSTFLDANEARINHRKAILRLFRMRAKLQTDYWKNQYRPSHGVTLTLFLNYPEWKEDALDLAILSALKSFPENIRSKEHFEKELDMALDKIGTEVSAFADFFEKNSAALESIRSLLKRLPRSWTRDDIKQQLGYLFRPGFLKCADAIEDYPRYLRSLQLRLERALGGGTAKDEGKGADLDCFIERFHLAARSCNAAEHPGLLNFFLLLEECRIAAFSPEIRTRKGSDREHLEKAWKTLRLN